MNSHYMVKCNCAIQTLVESHIEEVKQGKTLTSLGWVHLTTPTVTISEIAVLDCKTHG